MMKIVGTAIIAVVVLIPLSPIQAAAACDELIGTIIAKHLRPVIENAECPVVKDGGLDKKGHKLAGVCYESRGRTSQIRIDTQLNCHASGESVVAKLLGGKNAPSISENVTVEAEARGADCKLLNVEVKPSGELGKVLADMFDANGRARQALDQGLAEVCKQ
jgi:hypothetical protein